MERLLGGKFPLARYPRNRNLKSSCASEKGLKMGLETRSTDAKGRVCLPKTFANATVIIEQVSENELLIRKAQLRSRRTRFDSPRKRTIVLTEKERERFLQGARSSSEAERRTAALIGREGQERG